ncbi:hypothetical protein DE146DRAFT_435225 [Phaeosphaeria sp. MPI-PUGE-AT-0046c]|nr:hypothetical protein DE146DRAFT_435225 [Phaeosphaeria sp. MPI-PUGE-AT-0046c]
MTHFVRPSRNFVNLGNLYQVAPLTTGDSCWAYFDDGSLFIVPRGGYPNHENLEVRMKIAAHLRTYPGDRLHSRTMRHEGPQRKRFVIAGRSGISTPRKAMLVSMRSASDGERIITPGRPFMRCELTLNRTGTFSPHVNISNEDKNIVFHAHLLREAMRTFRGTLIDGILQPNVRLRNGLILREMKGLVPWEVSMRRLVNDQMSPGFDMDEVATREAALQAKERELGLREELLRWKHKSLKLEEQLIKATDDLNSRSQTRPRRTPRYSNEDDRSFNPRVPVDNSPTVELSGYGLRAHEETVPRDTKASASTHPVSHAGDVPELTPSVPLDGATVASTPSADDEDARESTGDMFASSVLGTDTSAPPALEGLRSLLAHADAENRSRTRHRRRSR